MKFYNQSELFNLLISAAERPGYTPDPDLLAKYRKNRLQAVIKAAKTRNLFIYTEGTRPNVELNSGITIYTQPVGFRLMLIGYSDNFRYGRISNASGSTDKIWPQTHRVRIVSKANPRTLVEDLVPAQAGVSGQPRFTSPILPVPEILEANEQIAIDLGYDTAANAPTAVEPQAFVFFTLRVKDKLTQQDEEMIADCKRAILANDFQKGQYLNCVSLGQQSVNFTSAAAGGTASCETRTITAPMLITGILTNLVASKVKITDTKDGSSFSLEKFIQVSALNMPDYEDQGATDLAAPASAPIYSNCFQLPMPHLLRNGSSLHADIVNGGDHGGGAGGVVDPQTGQVLMFQGISV